MSFIDANKLKYYEDRIKGDRVPITADIILNNFCNYSCDYCRYKHGKEYMSYKVFEMVVSRLIELGIRGFILTGGGEPTLNPDFDKIVTYLEDNELPYGVNTNFSVYKDMEPTWLKVSMHKCGDIAKVLDNIKRYRERDRKTTLGVQGIIERVEDIELFYNQYKDCDVDYISFRPLEMMEEVYNKGDIELILGELNRLKEKDNRVLINYKWDMIDKKFNNCLSNWGVITVDYNTNVWYCCHKPEEVVGSIFDKDILEKKALFKTDMNKCEKPCRMSANNLYMEYYKEGKHIEFI